MSAVRIQHWSVAPAPGQEYTAPEMASKVLVGKVYGHPRKADGKVVRTSGIVAAQGREVKTSSGTTYRLGAIDPKYRQWMRDNGIEYNPKQPIKVRG